MLDSFQLHSIILVRFFPFLSRFLKTFLKIIHLNLVGTCGMGRVVDTQLRVYGTQRLRVIDASIQPEIVTTNTQASTLMIGEKV